MGKTIQIRELDDEVYAGLVVRAAEAGVTVPELLRREAVRLVSRPSLQEWLARTRRRPAAVTPEATLAAFDQTRGRWPN